MPKQSAHSLALVLLTHAANLVQDVILIVGTKLNLNTVQFVYALNLHRQSE